MLTCKYASIKCLPGRQPSSNACTLWTLNGKFLTPRSNLWVDPHISSPFVLSLAVSADMDDVSVTTDCGCRGQNLLHGGDEIESLSQNLLRMGKDEADCETGLQLSRSECNQI